MTNNPCFNLQVSLPLTNVKSVIKEEFSTNDDKSMDIWELATQIDKDIPEDIWEVVCKYFITVNNFSINFFTFVS